MKALWEWIVAYGFRLLYNELAWLYDPVSWVASLGKWRRWQATIWPYLPPHGRILEVGAGPGHLLADLSRAGYRVAGMDASWGMVRLARKRLQRLGLAVPLCQGEAGALPFAPHSFDGVIATFPTRFAYEPGWINQLQRILKEEAQVVIVETSRFPGHTLPERVLEWLYEITSQRKPTPDLPRLLEETGLCARHEWVTVSGTSVRLSVAQKRGQLLETTAGDPEQLF
jgi:ubiquinone/menaquinone biosynthesis C-methylase UbiE